MDNIPNSRRTDLAIETRELYQKDSGREVPGVSVDKIKQNQIDITRVNIFNDEGSRIMGKPIGNYVTLDVPFMVEADENIKEIAKSLSKELINLTTGLAHKNILVVGLGNWNITPDALGPKVISKIFVTRHIFELTPFEVKPGMVKISAFAPGVLGLTGIETADIVKGVVDRIKPDLIIAVDALASRSMSRVCATIQISDTGVNPGSGIGNHRLAFNKETMGIPVIAIGIPTVVDAATMANDTIDLLIDTLIKASNKEGQFYETLKKMDKNDKYNLIKEVISPFDNLMVTPKEVDEMIENMSYIVSEGINTAFQGEFLNES